jgi:hypothetical protein
LRAEADAGADDFRFDTDDDDSLRFVAQQAGGGEQFQGVAFVSGGGAMGFQLFDAGTGEDVDGAGRVAEANCVEDDGELAAAQVAEKGEALGAAVDEIDPFPPMGAGLDRCQEAEAGAIVGQEKIAEPQYEYRGTS